MIRQVQPDRRGERGQIVAIFALSLVVVITMAGLVIDGGFTFVQRRDQQNVVDAAALAAAYAYGNASASSSDATKTGAARSAALAIAGVNGYTQGTGGVNVTVTWDAPGGAGRHFTVTIVKPHRNYFAGIVGMPTWDVATTATSEAGRPNAALGAMPIIVNEKAFVTNGAGPSHPFTYVQAGDTGPNPIPQQSTTFNWTMYCDRCNADTNTVVGLIAGGGTATVVNLDDKIDPLNSGVHNPLFTALEAKVGTEFPIPIVNDFGKMVGWAMFHLTESNKTTRVISGWFVSPINPSAMTIVDGVTSGGDAGSYIARLVH